MPEISFVLPTKNRIEWLPECLMTLFAQTLDDIEIIVVNDNSDDGTKEFLEDWAVKDPRCIVIHNEKSLGAGGSRNKGMSLAKSSIIAVCDDDDTYPDGRAEVVVNWFKNNPQSEMVNFPYLQVGYFNQEIEKFRGEPFNHELFIKTGAVNFFSNPTLAFKKEVMEKIGGYPSENNTSTDDYQMLKKWVNAGHKIDFDPSYYLCFHRVLPTSMMAHMRGFKKEWVE